MTDGQHLGATDGPTFDHLHITNEINVGTYGYFGANDVTRGIVYAYGPATGGNFGGAFLAYTGADYDTVVGNYGFMIFEDDLYIGPDTNVDALKLDPNDDLYITGGSLILPASEYVNFGGTQGSGGYGLRDNAGAVEYCDSGGAWTALNAGGGGSGDSMVKDVAQAAHSLAVGDVVKCTGANTYAKAQADSAANAEVAGIVSVVTDAANFTLLMGGYWAHANVPAVAAGTVVFLSPTSAGGMTSTEPSTAGQVSKPLGIVVENAAKMLVFNMRGVVLATAAQDLTTTAGPTFDHVHLGANQIATTSKARAYGTATQTGVADATYTQVNLVAESYDPGSAFDTTNKKYVAPVTGYYQVAHNIYWTDVHDGCAYISAVYVGGAIVSLAMAHAATAALDSTAGGSDIIYLTAGQEVKLYGAWYGLDDTSDIYAGSAYTFLAIHLLSIA